MYKVELNNVVCQNSSDYEILGSAYEYIEKLEEENKLLKEQFDMIYKGKKLKLLSIEKCKNKYCFNYELESGDSNE